ncbi:hypothetical protein DEU56DRAFT_758033 [Suillus clintonianus]|uniref:uncharacterized protein n=1 Tax=Suillus clintonianus TaxID=1904413 RepID=UPI001B86C509|nr:uncharacterized protein DEU56DRAFT_758033 [Suillus clintonianus]KAG2129748.1 hypothetical protein DEU56DRAFT_758033 [Suillus clintonianus]
MTGKDLCFSLLVWVSSLSGVSNSVSANHLVLRHHLNHHLQNVPANVIMLMSRQGQPSVLKDMIKDIFQTAVLCGYNLNDALATQTQAEIVLTVQNLLQDNVFLNRDIKVGGQTITVPFANKVVQCFMQHVLFHQFNLQQYVNSGRNLRTLLAFIGTLFEWVLEELSTGIFISNDFDLPGARIAFNNKLNDV